jgi:hypothetical protein
MVRMPIHSCPWLVINCSLLAASPTPRLIMSNLRSFSIEIFRFPRFVSKNNEHFHVFSIKYNRNTSFRFANKFFFLKKTFCLFRKFLSPTFFSFHLQNIIFLLEPNVFRLRIFKIELLCFVSLSNFNPDRTFFRFRLFLLNYFVLFCFR